MFVEFRNAENDPVRINVKLVEAYYPRRMEGSMLPKGTTLLMMSGTTLHVQESQETVKTILEGK